MVTFSGKLLRSDVRMQRTKRFSRVAFLLIPVFFFALSHSTYAIPTTIYSTWQNYQAINVTPSATDAAATVTNFPLLVHLTASSAVWASCNSNGYDIRFTNADGTVDYPFQRAAWNYSTTTGSAEFWVLVPTIAAGPAVTSLRMYWGNTAATDVSSGSTVFKTANNYVAVWHMNAASGTSESDATGSGHDAVVNGTPGTVVGPSGDSAKSFDGTSQYYRVNNSGAGSTLAFPVGGPITISTWINPLALQSCKAILGKIYTGSCVKWTGSYGLVFNGSTAGQLRGNDINGTASERCQYTLTANTWINLVWIRNGVGTALTNTNLYVNGISSGGTVASGTTYPRNDSLTFCIGKDADSATGTATYWAGQISETQISNVVRDTNWIRLSYKNQLSATGLTTFGTVTTTPPVAPTLTAPANATTGIALAPSLTWGTVSNAATYRVQVSTISTFATTVVDDSTLTVGTKAITGLVNNTTYYWQVNAKNAGGTSAWSTAFSFTTVMAAPAAPALTTPANAATGIALAPTLTWGTVTGAATYRVQLSTVSTFATTVADDSTLTVGTKAITGLANSTTYYWQVNAKNVGGTSAYSSVFSFTTVPVTSGVPTLTAPSDGATGTALAPTLTWGTVSGAATYRVQLSTISTFATTVVDDSTLTAGTKAITGLVNSTKYYWRVNAKNAGGTSAWATAYSFTTIVAAPATAPVLTTPANAATGISVTPTLTWGTVTGAATYRVQLSTISTFVTTVVDDSTLTAGTKAITSALTVNVMYYWRVNAKNAGGTSAWSTLSGFTTVTTGIIAATPHYVPATMGHNGVLEVYMANGSRVMEIAYGASATKTQLLGAASKTLAKGYYTYRFRSADAHVDIVGKLVK